MTLRASSSVPLYLGSFAYASLPAASSSSGRTALASDVGVAPGLLLISDGARWLPSGVQVLARGTVAFYLAPTGTMANNGAVTLGTALPLTYTQGLYLHLPANAIQAGSAAGWYWTVMSSATVGAVYQNTYTSGVPTIPGSPTAWTSTGPGAFTGETSEVDGPQITLPANLIGIQGTVEVYAQWTETSSASGKTHKWYLAANNLHALIPTSVAGAETLWSFTNDNSAAAQIAANNGYGPGSANAVNRFTTDTSVAQTMKLSLTRPTATEVLGLDRFVFRVMP